MQDTIIDTLKSCLNQDYIGDFEVLIVDNCSTDQTFDLASQFCNSNPKFRVIKNEKNLGVYGNHNKCIELAKYNWIKFLHGDDLLLDNCLSELSVELTEEVDLVFFDFVGNDYYNNLNKEKIRLDRSQSKLLIEFGNFIGTPTTTIFKKNKIDLFDLELNPASDGDAWIDLFDRNGALFINKKLAILGDDPFSGYKNYERNRLMFLEFSHKQLHKWKNSGRFNHIDWDKIFIYDSFRFFDSSLLLISKFRVRLFIDLIQRLFHLKILFGSYLFYFSNKIKGRTSADFRKKSWFEAI
jgi:glycosyltransferase involved in cell wall biosynthesis